MILIGIVGLCVVAALWVLLYFYFIRRTDRFMENWEREIKEKADKSTLKSIQALEEVAKGIEGIPESIQSLEEAAEAIKTSRKAMEKFAYERGFIPKYPSQEITTPESAKEPQLEPRAISEEVEILKERMKDLPVYLDRSASVSKGKGKEDAMEGLRTEGKEAMYEGRWREAIDYFQKALTLASGKDKTILLHRVGICNYFIGNLDQALANFEESLSQAREVQDRQTEAVVLGNIGLIYQKKDDLDKALKCYEDALKIDSQIGRREHVAIGLSNIAQIYQAKGDLDSALKYLENALKIAKDIGFREGEASDLDNIGVIYQIKGENDKALRLYEDALKIFKEIGAEREIEITERNIQRLLKTE